MITEIWDILNENGVATGKTTVRGAGFLKQGEYHLVVHIWIISSDGKILIQKRSPQKKLMPGEWAATGGAAISGENSFDAASRELFEELGIYSTPETLKKLFRIKRRNSLLDVWAINCDLPLEELKLQPSEVCKAEWVTKSHLEEMIKSGEYHNYGKEYFEKVFSKIDRFIGATL
jgi:isopentenyldiphosphate isomerase